jgi:para-nitrobenzyl esterase
VNAEPIARTTSGLLRGRHRRGALRFLGIPYAAPPVGPLRFRPPAPAEPWSGVLDASRPGPAAPQLPGTGLTNSLPVRWDEDCLTLNVVTPAVDDARRPVLVWIHGGDYRHGQGAIPWYDGAGFARAGIVTVTINYRLGALGFTDLGALDPAYGGAGVAGSLDQVAALRWVRANIGAFGGDPDRITVAGESAGAFSVATLLASPAAAGLFRRAILQSGAGHHVHTRESSGTVARMLLHELRLDDPAQLAGVDPVDLLEAQAAVESAAGDPFGRDGLRLPCGPFYPTLDPALLDARPVELAARGAGSDVAVLIGTNADETTLFGMGQARDLDHVATVLRRRVADADAVLDAYRAARPDAAPSELLVAATSDWTFRIPAIRLAEARLAAGAAPTWMYGFSWRSRAFDGALGATHALEIPFVFDTLDAPGVGLFLGEGPTPTALAATMHAAWAAFVRGDDPTPALGLDWPAYTLDGRAVHDFGEPCRLVADPGRAERLAWEGRR